MALGSCLWCICAAYVPRDDNRYRCKNCGHYRMHHRVRRAA